MTDSNELFRRRCVLRVLTAGNRPATLAGCSGADSADAPFGGTVATQPGVDVRTDASVNGRPWAPSAGTLEQASITA